MAMIYDRFMDATEEACLRRWRGELLADLEGDVLELGAGTGANLPHHPRDLSRLVLTEPDKHMRRQLEARAREHRPDAEVTPASASALPFADASFDAVVSTLVLCSVPELDTTLREVWRVLKPGGRFLFLEHVAAAPGTGRRRLQRVVDPLWRRVADGCRLTRDTERAMLDAGFTLERIERESMRKAMAIVRPSIRGVARRPAE